MLKSDLIRLMNKNFPELQTDDVELALNCILRQLTQALAQGKRIEIRNFGSFDLRHRPARIGRNPKSGEAVQLVEKSTVYFKPGKQMKERVCTAMGRIAVKS